MTPECRPATDADSDAVAHVYLCSRRELVAGVPVAHSDEDVREWIRRHLIPQGRTTVALVDRQIVGFLAVSNDARGSWIDQLYVHPTWIGRGIGSMLLDCARHQLSPPIRLYTFQINERARRFYERRGFRTMALGDGSGNEERCPDVLYEWSD